MDLVDATYLLNARLPFFALLQDNVLDRRPWTTREQFRIETIMNTTVTQTA